MRLHKVFVLVYVLLQALPNWAQDKTAAAQAFAVQVLKTFDASEFAKMYDEQFADNMKQAATKQQWIKTAQTIREQRGDMVDRTLASKTKSMGIYRFIFSTQCTGGKVFEDVTVTEQNGAWKAGGFYVRPNLE